MLFILQDGDSLFVDIPETRSILNLGKSSTKVYEIIKDNGIQHMKIGRRWEISRQSLYDYINKQLEKSSSKQ